MKNPFFPLAAWVYGKLKPVVHKKQDQKLIKALMQLHPLGNTEKLYDDFQINKLALIFLVLAIGIVSAISLHLSSRMERRLADGAQLVRNEWGAGDYKLTLHAVTEEWSREIPFLVEERELTEDEKEYLKNKLYSVLPDLIRKDNSDLNHVTGDLALISSVPGYPFRLTWDSSNSERIKRNGEVNRKEVGEEGEIVNLTVTVSFEQEISSFIYKVLLLPETLDEEEGFFRSLENSLLTADLEGRNQRQISLPENFQGKNIRWEKVSGDNSFLVFLLFSLGGLLAGKGMENDLEKSRKKRNRQLISDYPGFVSKLRLYLSAGLTVKNAFLRMTADYANHLKQGKQQYLLEEMQISCHQLENGVMEEQVYQEFGKRCGEMRYRRLSFLLAVHLKQGNDQLLMLLAKEADDAQEDRKNMARKKGEEAGTKLLLPMMLMLIVVMLLVLMPAYLDFGSV